MITLGINAAFHDSAAAIVLDGVVIAASEEERYTRIKHAKRPVPFSAWELPFHAIDDCLRQAGATLADVDHVAYSYNPDHILRDRLQGARMIQLPLEPSAQDAGEWDNVWDPLFAAYMVNAPRQLCDGVPHHLRHRWQDLPRPAPWTWHPVDHHLCHQASAFLASPFAHCAVMTLDGRGELATTSYGVAEAGRYTALGQVNMPHSLGLLYERVTQHLGFLHSSDEYKVMALAALGQPRFRDALQAALRVEGNGQFNLGPLDLEALTGPRRRPGDTLSEAHLDLAASLQDVLEDTVLALARWLREASGARHLALAGGVALNCVMNARLRDSGIFDAVWVQPAAGDAGTALGAALWVDARMRQRAFDTVQQPETVAPVGQPLTLATRQWQMDDACLGPAYDDEHIESLLRWAGLPYRKLQDPAREVAALLAQDQIIGWFQGRMEFGPRALGARSILASPLHGDMQRRLNELKDREDFRPVAPVVPQECLSDWFSPADANGGESPFMLFIYDVLPAAAERIPAACHIDRTARVQTVSAERQPALHALLRAFGERTGVPVLVNTSFNVRGQPMVCSPRDALEAFYTTPLDAVVMGNFVVDKSPRLI